MVNIEKINEVLIVGLGRSGVAAAELLLSEGKKVKISEEKQANSFSPFLIERLKQQKVELEFGGHTKKFFSSCQLVVVSPGVDLNSPGLKNIIGSLDLPVIGEIELGCYFNRAKIIAITGTNGKTTTTFLTYQLLKKNIKSAKVYLGGNIGIPFCSFAVNTTPEDIVVLEISSFQLETIQVFHPYIAVILNIQPDHLDRYPDFDSYAQAKFNIFCNQNEKDWAVINQFIPKIDQIKDKIKSQIKYFDFSFPQENYAAIASIADIFKIEKTAVAKEISNFNGLPHRLQKIAEFQGIVFINDSKATNINSTIWAINQIKQPILLICGGKDKGMDYNLLAPYLSKIKEVFIIGQAAPKIKQAIEGKVNYQLCASLEKALWFAWQKAKKGDCILLSPMCASFDMFANYIERGNKFRLLVKNLIANK